MQILPVTLTGRWLCLEPLDTSHKEALRVAADDERIWQHLWMAGRGDDFDKFFAEALMLRDARKHIPFVVRRLVDNKLVGTTRYINPVEQHRRVEIGATWYVPEVWGTQINLECKLLLLTHAFEIHGANRVELITDVQNQRSQAAIAKIGAIREGVMRSHMIVKEGRIRDSVLFSITSSEWPEVKQRLAAKLAAIE